MGEGNGEAGDGGPEEGKLVWCKVRGGISVE